MIQLPPSQCESRQTSSGDSCFAAAYLASGLKHTSLMQRGCDIPCIVGVSADYQRFIDLCTSFTGRLIQLVIIIVTSAAAKATLSTLVEFCFRQTVL